MSDCFKAELIKQHIKINQIPDTPVARGLRFKVLITDDDCATTGLGTHRVHITLPTEIVTNGNSCELGTHRVPTSILATRQPVIVTG